MGPAETRSVCARGLAQLLAYGEVLEGPPIERLRTFCAGDREALSVLAARARGPDGERSGREVTALRTTAACGLAARWQEELAERRIPSVPLGGVAHVGRLYRSPGERLVERACLLVSPYDAARARVAMASGGLERTGSPGRDAVVFRSGDLEILLRWGLHPPGWSSLPISPFLEGEAGAPPGPATVLPVVASWAAHRLLLASTLWRRRRPLELAEAAALGTLAGEEERHRWGVLARRWGVGRLWRRAGELEAWLLGGRRPAWLSEAPAVAEGRGEWLPPLTEGLRLQDTPARAAAFLVRWVLLRLRR